jgi:hypothetical protein
MQIWTIKSNSVYIVSFTAENVKYDKYIGLANQMVDSFTITK